MAEVTNVADDGRTFSFVAVRYNVIDSYGTMFAPGCFADSLRNRVIKVTWGHSPSHTPEPIGHVVSYDDGPEQLTMVARLSEPDSVPRAKQAMAQLRDGDIDEMSVGGPIGENDEMDMLDGNVVFKRVELEHVAVVLSGAVPGARMLAIRSAPSLVIPVDLAGEIAARLKTGEIDLLEALQEMKDASVAEVETEGEREPEAETEPGTENEETEPETVEVEPPPAEEEVEETAPETADDDLADLLAEADAAVAKVI